MKINRQCFFRNHYPILPFLLVFGSVYFGIVSRRRRPPKSKNPPKKWQHLTGITGSLSSEWVAGFASDYPAALLVVIFPTSCSGSNSEFIENMILSESYPLFGHNNGIYNTIHLLSAGLFLFIMGWMSLFRFTKGNKEEKKNKNRIYKLAGYVILGSILILALEFIIGFQISNYDVFALETVSVLSFGIAWLIKGKALKDLSNLGTQINKFVVGNHA